MSQILSFINSVFFLVIVPNVIKSGTGTSTVCRFFATTNECSIQKNCMAMFILVWQKALKSLEHTCWRTSLPFFCCIAVKQTTCGIQISDNSRSVQFIRSTFHHHVVFPQNFLLVSKKQIFIAYVDFRMLHA